jgi:hypothetical protein
MTTALLAIPVRHEHGGGTVHRWLGPAWPLKLLLLGFPLWWALGVGSLAFLVAAAAMAVQMVRRGWTRVPTGFGLWVLFLLWMMAGAAMLWVNAPGTIAGGGPERLVGFSYRVLWYLAITVAMLYPLSIPAREVPSARIARWLAVLFITVVAGGLAGFVAPSFEFTSPAELIVPGAGGDTFINALLHPSLTTHSEFLGYEQPRPKAPFAYANAWGNNVGLLLPFFVYAGIATTRRRWGRFGTVLVLALLTVPVVYSLNRGLWLGLAVMAVYVAVVLARFGRFGALWGLAVCVLVGCVLIVGSPLGSTIALRLDTPHSNGRRATVAEVVSGTTWAGSPLLGYGTTRKVTGSFASIAGGETPDCRQCAAPPLGTQGFLWRLVFTTGFVGTAFFLGFLGMQFFTHARRRGPFSLLGCIVLTTGALFFLFYDSLESPLFILMLAVGLMNRERLDEDATALAT